MTHMNRRAVIAGATAAAIATPAMASTSTDADMELFAALKRWQEAAAALKVHSASFVGDEPNGKELQAAFDTAVLEHDAIMHEAIDTPAKTLEGFKAKVKAISDSDFFNGLGTDDYAKAAGVAMLADIVALHGPLPDQWAFPRA